MPVYEYFCHECNHEFTQLRPMSEHKAGAACPGCGGTAGRLLSAPRLSMMDPGVRKAHQINERSAHEPRVSRRHQCGPGCSHNAATSTGTALKAQSGVKRPWMLGH
ncbi:MAG: zinc ribbon domain-containing protein [Gammaproteobacteria bacterium]|nr:zinc ribbon domain-containing protein [Gammaproteobacteria bacterium]